MSQKLDHNQIATAGLTGLTARIISERLDCSERQVHRVLEERGIRVTPNPLIGTEDEPLLWRQYRTWGDSYRQIGYRFCVSHETVRLHLSEPHQVGEPVSL